MAGKADTAVTKPRRSAPLDWASLRPAVTDELLAGMARRIVERFQPEKVVLFGSYAYGQPTLDSDVDLLVIMESDEPFLARVRKVRAAARVDLLPMDVVVYTPDEIEDRLAKGDHFVADILSRGVPLYDRARRADPEGRG